MTDRIADKYRIAPAIELPADLHPYTRALAEAAERRAQAIQGLRNLAQMLVDHPDLPTPYSIVAQAGPCTNDPADRNVVLAAASALGEELCTDDADKCTARADLSSELSMPYVAYTVHHSWVVDPSPAAAAAEVPADLALPRNPQGGLDLAALDAQVGLAPMTGAEALDAAATPEEFGAVLNGIFDAFAQAARDEADREHVVRISFNSSKYLVKCDAGDLFEVATRLDEAEMARAAHEAGAS